MSKPIASLSLDLDNKWSYMKTHGDAGWETFPSYLDVCVPRVLEFLAERNLTITFFVVGQDAALEQNREALASIPAAGHEVGNHSFHHEPWLHLYGEDEVREELSRAEQAIEAATGVKPLGFRGPGFSLAPTVLRVLSERGYAYDCSTFPTFLGPLARLYYFCTSRLDQQQKQQRKQLFGRLNEGFKPLSPYYWAFGKSGENLMEIPVTTMPLFKVPIHVSYLLYLATYSRLAARTYWSMAMSLCRLTGVAPSLLLHPLDFLGCDDEQDLSFFPAMNVPSRQKLSLLSDVLASLRRHYDVRPMIDHAVQIQSQVLSKQRRLRRVPVERIAGTNISPEPATTSEPMNGLEIPSLETAEEVLT